MGKKETEEVQGPTGPCPFGVEPERLNDINTNKDLDGLKSLGGAEGIAKALMTNLVSGIDPTATGDASIETRAAWFGLNKFKETPPKNFFALMYENLHDPIIILLIGAAAVSTALGAAIPEQRKHAEWIEGVAIWVAVFLVSGVGAANDYQKDQQFRKLNAQKDVIDIKVMRGHQQILVKNSEIVVGDIVLLDTGDKLIADGVVFSTQGLVIDEASLTGESDPIKKNVEEDPWCRSGTQVSEGSGRMLVLAVGESSEWGKTMALMEEAGDENTPLQDKLEDVAGAIGKVGFGVAIACFVALLIKWCVENKGFPVKRINDSGPVQFFLYGVTIIVVAVPEGLPLAVTISLAYSMKKMLKDNNFVRVLSACETMGGATAICSDKTGTLTENRMTVVEGWFAGHNLDHAPTPEELQPELLNELKLNMALNSKAFLVDHGPGKIMEFVGNRTECALLMLCQNLGADYQQLRDDYAPRLVQLNGFTSARKMASVLIKLDDRYRLYNKGAAEWVLKKCTRVYNEYGQIDQLTDEGRDGLMAVVTGMAKRGLRCICLTYVDYALSDEGRPPGFLEDPEQTDNDLICMAIVGIKDPVRKEVPAAVATCQRAGIVVRMVTGDNIFTAQHIARECGILRDDEGHIAMEGPTFRNMNHTELSPQLPNLRVLARSSPEDKLTLVNMLKKEGEVVAVTGDGTNDAPALKESDVGLAMGIAGTEVAKEAADIIILDDNFSSIVKSVLWGRSVFNNIRKFLQFQLTVNGSALAISFIGAIIGGHEPLNVLQLLWVNLIMDTMGALALATELPSPALLDQPPHGREEPLINKKMWKHIAVQSVYQMFWMLICLYGLPNVMNHYKITEQSDYYSVNAPANCQPKLKSEYPSWSDTDINSYCYIMRYCGFPAGSDAKNSGLCPLWPAWQNYKNSYGGAIGIPDDPLQAICYPPVANGTVENPDINSDKSCGAYYDNFDTARSYMASEFKSQEDDDWKKPLSVLFNAFILMQVANEVNARRINDELDLLSGITHSPIFLTVIFVTLGFQAIIMQTPVAIFFKVVSLNGAEWGACLAIGLGSSVLSLATRLISKYLFKGVNPVAMRRMGSGRTTSGRTASGRTASGNRVQPVGGPPKSGSGGNGAAGKEQAWPAIAPKPPPGPPPSVQHHNSGFVDHGHRTETLMEV